MRESLYCNTGLGGSAVGKMNAPELVRLCCLVYGVPTTISPPRRGTNMDSALKAKLDEARQRLNSRQIGINAERKHDD